MGGLGLGPALGESLVKISATSTAHRRRHSTPAECHRVRITALLAAVVATIGVSPAQSGTPDELMTAPNAILCLSRDSLDAANEPAISKSQTALRAMGCCRSESGIAHEAHGKS